MPPENDAAPGGTTPPAASGGTPTPAASGGTPVPGASGGTPTTPWFGTTVKPETKGTIEMKGWGSLDSVVESYANLEKLAKAPADRIVHLPAPLPANADEATKKAYEAEFGKIYDRLGRPAKPEDYKLTSKDNGDFLKTASKWLHDAGLSTAQAQRLAASWEAHNEKLAADATATYEASIKEASEAQHVKWGAAYEKNLTVARGAMAMLGLDAPAVDALEKALGWGKTMDLLYSIGTKIGEDKFIGGESALKGTMSPDEAKARKAALKADKAWVTRWAAGGANEKAEMEKLEQYILAGS